jgi:hypothetical protein
MGCIVGYTVWNDKLLNLRAVLAAFRLGKTIDVGVQTSPLHNVWPTYATFLGPTIRQLQARVMNNKPTPHLPHTHAAIFNKALALSSHAYRRTSHCMYNLAMNCDHKST